MLEASLPWQSIPRHVLIFNIVFILAFSSLFFENWAIQMSCHLQKFGCMETYKTSFLCYENFNCRYAMSSSDFHRKAYPLPHRIKFPYQHFLHADKPNRLTARPIGQRITFEFCWPQISTGLCDLHSACTLTSAIFNLGLSPSDTSPMMIRSMGNYLIQLGPHYVPSDT